MIEHADKLHDSVFPPGFGHIGVVDDEERVDLPVVTANVKTSGGRVVFVHDLGCEEDWNAIVGKKYV